MTDDAGAHNYSYDSLDRLTAATHPNQTTESYTYDDVGNRTASHQGSSYTYQPFNRLVGANGSSFGYDTNGNLTSKTDASGSWSYAWDYENRLKQASKASGVTVSNSYDALGRRVQRTGSSSGTTKFVYDGADVMRDLDGNGNTVADFLNGPGVDNKLRQTTGATASYFVTDHLGTTRALTDTSGNLAASLSYDSFGKITSGSAASRYTYTGRESDLDTGLMYYRARWYDPQMVRFISEDPLELRGGIDFYTYVKNNSSNFVDPSGMQRADARWQPGELEWAEGLRRQMARWPTPADDCPCYSLRPPDFYQMQFNFSVPFTGGRGSYSPSQEIDSYGNLYSSYRGGGFGPSWKTPGISVTAGWLLNQPPGGPDEKTLRNFSTRSSFSGGGGYWVGGFLSHSPNGPTAFQCGFVSPQVGGGYSYSEYDGKIQDLPGPSQLADDILNLYGGYPH